MNELVTQAPASLPTLNRQDYDCVIARFNDFLNGRTANEETIREFFEHESATYSASSIQLHKCAIKAAVKRAFPSHDLRFHSTMDALFKSIRVPKRDTKVKDSDLFTKAEIRKIIKVAPVHVGLILQALYDTGSRISECLSIKLKDCRQDRKAMRARILGKGSKERDLIIDLGLFRRIQKHFRGKVWLFEHNGRRYSRQHIWLEISKAGRLALGRRVHPHASRHSRLTHLLDDRQPLAAVSRFAGHSQITTTLAFYSHNVLATDDILKSRL